MEEQKDIGNIFRERFKTSQMPVHQDEWDEMGMKLSKMRFTRFSISHFNIYYCILITSCFIISASVFVKAFLIDTDSQVSKNKIEVKGNEIQLIDSSNSVIGKEISVDDAVESKNAGEVSVNKNQSVSPIVSPGNVRNLPKDTLNAIQVNGPGKIDLPIAIPHKDTLSGKVDSDKEVKTNQAKRSKKIVYVVKQDTVVVVDTLKNKKFVRRR